MKGTESINLQKKADIDFITQYGLGFLIGIIAWIFYGLLWGTLAGVITVFIAKWVLTDRTIVARGSFILPSALSSNVGCYEVIPKESLLESDNDTVSAILEQGTKQTKSDVSGTLIFFVGLFKKPESSRPVLQRFEIRRGPPRHTDRQITLKELHEMT